MTEQTGPVTSPSWLYPSPPSFAGYTRPDRSRPALADLPSTGPLVTVLGTVRDEAVPLERSLHVWARQLVPTWLRGRVEVLILDDGSADHEAVRAVVHRHVEASWRLEDGPRLVARILRVREPGAIPERSCTLAMNVALRQLVHAPLVMVQWWDRIPGSFRHLAELVAPHVERAGIVTSAISRHVGGSSSMHEMASDVLASILSTVDWRRDPRQLAVVAGEIGGHCVPGGATESSGLVASLAELIAVGGFDERYRSRASYVNVELWRRLLQVGLVAVFPSARYGENYHQSHGGKRAKDLGWLTDPLVRRNQGVDWGTTPVLSEERLGSFGCEVAP